MSDKRKIPKRVEDIPADTRLQNIEQNCGHKTAIKPNSVSVQDLAVVVGVRQIGRIKKYRQHVERNRPGHEHKEEVKCPEGPRSPEEEYPPIQNQDEKSCPGEDKMDFVHRVLLMPIKGTPRPGEQMSDTESEDDRDKDRQKIKLSHLVQYSEGQLARRKQKNVGPVLGKGHLRLRLAGITSRSLSQALTRLHPLVKAAEMKTDSLRKQRRRRTPGPSRRMLR
jgi:hypothetical protein